MWETGGVLKNDVKCIQLVFTKHILNGGAVVPVCRVGRALHLGLEIEHGLNPLTKEN